MRTFLFLLWTFVSPAFAEEPPDTKGWKVLHDFSQPLPRASAFPEKKQRETLNRIFPRHLKNGDRCVATARPATVPGVMRKTVCFPLTSPKEKKSDCSAEILIPQPEVDLRLGNFLPKLLWHIPGSFTEAGAPQEAAMAEIGYCSGGSSKKLFVLSEGKVVHEREIVIPVPYLSPPYIHSFDYGSGAKALDVDGDGRDEILTETKFYATMDVDRSYATLLTLRKSNWDLVATFDQTVNGRCDHYYTDQEQYYEVKVVKYRPPSKKHGKKLADFETETKDVGCR